MTPSIFAGLSGPNNVKACGDAHPATQPQRACLDFKIVLWLFVFVHVVNICVVPSNLPGWRWAGIKQLALVGSSSSLHSEACKALGGSDGVIHSRISDSGGRVRANASMQSFMGVHRICCCCARSRKHQYTITRGVAGMLTKSLIEITHAQKI